MMLPFSGQLEKILDGTNTMTTRLDAKEWQWNALMRHLRTGEAPILHMWWPNPRNRHPDCYKIGKVKCIGAWRRWGDSFTEGCAKMDGFDTVYDYKAALANLGKRKMTIKDVNLTLWTQIIWGNECVEPIWLDGPYKPRRVA